MYIAIQLKIKIYNNKLLFFQENEKKLQIDK
jgi:hypothetical protein